MESTAYKRSVGILFYVLNEYKSLRIMRKKLLIVVNKGYVFV